MPDRSPISTLWISQQGFSGLITFLQIWLVGQEVKSRQHVISLLDIPTFPLLPSVLLIHLYLIYLLITSPYYSTNTQTINTYQPCNLEVSNFTKELLADLERISFDVAGLPTAGYTYTTKPTLALFYDQSLVLVILSNILTIPLSHLSSTVVRFRCTDRGSRPGPYGTKRYKITPSSLD